MRREITERLIKQLHNQFGKKAMYAVPEVSMIDKGDNYKDYGRVDYMIYDQQETFKFYEIKSCKEDFYSDAKWTFIGHLNYFVIPEDLLAEVINDIPDHIGVYVLNKQGLLESKKRAKREELVLKKKVYLDRMIVSLARDAHKYYKLSDQNEMSENLRSCENEVSRLTRENSRLYSNFQEVDKERKALIRILRKEGYTLEDIDKCLEKLN